MVSERIVYLSTYNYRPIDAVLMFDMDLLSYVGSLLSSRRKVSKLTKHLDNLDQIIDW